MQGTRYSEDGFDASTIRHEFHDCYWHGCLSCYQNRTEQKNIPDCMGVKGKACTF